MEETEVQEKVPSIKELNPEGIDIHYEVIKSPNGCLQRSLSFDLRALEPDEVPGICKMADDLIQVLPL